MARTILMGMGITLLLGVSVWLSFNADKTKTVADAPTPDDPVRAAELREEYYRFREEHKETFALSRMISNINRLEEAGQHTLTAKQAKDMLAILKPLRSQRKLTQPQAKTILDRLQQTLTAAQHNAIAALPDQRWGGRPNGYGQGGSQSGAAGERPQFDVKAMKDFNPFNPATDGPLADRISARMEKLLSQLEAKVR